MELILLFVILLGYIFLTSSIAKIRNIEEHISAIVGYKIIPLSWSRWLAYIDATVELIGSLGLLLLIYLNISLVLILLLLILYTLAISINLAKGRTDIDCGCGGIVGNHKLSFGLVIRNVIFITIGVITLILNLYEPVSITNISNKQMFLIIHVSVGIAFIILILSRKLVSTKREIKNL